MLLNRGRELCNKILKVLYLHFCLLTESLLNSSFGHQIMGGFNLAPIHPPLFCRCTHAHTARSLSPLSLTDHHIVAVTAPPPAALPPATHNHSCINSDCGIVSLLAMPSTMTMSMCEL